MQQYTGNYERQSKNRRISERALDDFYYYTFTPKPLSSGGFYTLDDELSALLSHAHGKLGFY